MTLDKTTEEEYNERFNEKEKIFLHREGIPLYVASRYHPRFSAFEVRIFVKQEISAKKMNAYDSHFSVEDIYKLIKRDVSPKEANKFNKRFKGEDISFLVGCGISPEEADSYDSRFSGYDIKELFEIGISPSGADSYRKIYSGSNICILHNLGIKYRQMSEAEERKLIDGYLDLYKEEFSKIDYCLFVLRGTGASGGVLTWDGLAWKFSLEIDKEYALLVRNHEFHNGEQKNTLKVKGPIRQDIVAMVEYIHGRSLKDILTVGRVEKFYNTLMEYLTASLSSARPASGTIVTSARPI